jgi:hypothetical protein
VYPAGTLIALPALCAHRWHNVTPGAYHNNLVFSRPTFTFNEFVKPDDPALLRASPPSIVDLPGRLSEFLKTDQAAELAALLALGGTLFTLFARDAYVVAARGKEPVSFYVVQGEGEIDAGKHSALKPGDLAVMTRGAGARLTAIRASRSWFYYFTSSGDVSASASYSSRRSTRSPWTSTHGRATT